MKPRSRPAFLAACVAAGLTSFAWPAWAGAPAGRYTRDPANHTVLDNKTGLMWQDYVTATYTWRNALVYCEAFTLAGYSDWRLPNVKELLTIVDVSAHDPAIDTTAFPSTPSDFFWSSSPAAGNTLDAWGVQFAHGAAGIQDTTTNYNYRLRCVRGGGGP